jgi:hypothetical protein
MVGITSPAQTAAIMSQMRAICSHYSEMFDQWLEYVKILREILNGEWNDSDAGYDWLYCNLPLLPALQEFHEMLVQELTEDRSRTFPQGLDSVYPRSEMTVDVVESFIELADCREAIIDRVKDEPAARQRAFLLCREILSQAEEDTNTNVVGRASSAAQKTARGDDPLAQLFKQLSVD